MNLPYSSMVRRASVRRLHAAVATSSRPVRFVSVGLEISVPMSPGVSRLTRNSSAGMAWRISARLLRRLLAMAVMAGSFRANLPQSSATRRASRARLKFASSIR